ncbi:hydantoinase/oxoprolinase N-terminal domain-containing protein [Streptomyces sp. NPDC002520]
MIAIGVKVGGSRTDAVALHEGAVIAKAVAPSLPGDPVRSLADAVRKLPAAHRAEAVQLSVGLNTAARAVMERQGLARVGVLRIGGAAVDAVPPGFGWPQALRRAVLADWENVDGGAGLTPALRTPLDRAAVTRFAERTRGRVQAYAVTGVFAPADGSQERESADLLGAEVPVVLSGEVAGLGLVERENATVLHAALSSLVARLADELSVAASTLTPRATVLVTRHDGTLAGLDYLRRQPGLTLGSGPASTIRGAALLAGLDDALVVDVGERRCRIGASTQGYPQEARAGERIGGVQVSLRFPELTVLTDPLHRLDELAEAVDSMQPGAEPLPVVLVGPRAAAVPDHALPGLRLLRPEHGEAAGAYGAAASLVGAGHERIYRPGDRSDPDGPHLDAVRDEVRELARAGAVRAGADPRSVDVRVDPELPVPYLPGAVLIRARAMGPPLPL